MRLPPPPEVISLEVCVANPLQVMLVLSEVSLLWTFIPALQGPDPPQLISNEITTGVKVQPLLS